MPEHLPAEQNIEVADTCHPCGVASRAVQRGVLGLVPMEVPAR